MIIKKMSILMITMILSIILCSCSTLKNKVFITDNLENPIIHKVYQYNERTNAEVLSIFNYNGNIIVDKSDTDNLQVEVKLIQKKHINDIDKKLNNLLIKPQIKDNIIFYEPLCKNNSIENYWEWIVNNLNANGISVDFEIHIPSSIKEIRIYNNIGNIDLNNITSRIYAQTNVGDINGKNISALDNAIFKVNVPKAVPTTNSVGINVDFSTLDKVNDIVGGIGLGKVNLSLPKNVKYNHEQITSKDMSIEYPFEVDSKNYFEHCRQESLKSFKQISEKKDQTLIQTSNSYNIIIKN